MKLRPLRAVLFHADGLTDKHDDAIRRFLKVCGRAQNDNGIHIKYSNSLMV